MPCASVVVQHVRARHWHWLTMRITVNFAAFTRKLALICVYTYTVNNSYLQLWITVSQPPCVNYTVNAVRFLIHATPILMPYSTMWYELIKATVFPIRNSRRDRGAATKTSSWFSSIILVSATVAELKSLAALTSAKKSKKINAWCHVRPRRNLRSPGEDACRTRLLTSNSHNPTRLAPRPTLLRRQHDDVSIVPAAPPTLQTLG